MQVEPSPPSHGALPAPGVVVGEKYRIERYIAEGGMGVIALGRHVVLDEQLALKFLKPEVVATDTTGTVAGRFVREARATIKIRSEHVPRIFDVATLDNGIPYIVMELLVGEDLDKRLEREGPLPVAFTVDMMLQALEAIAAAHALGMVHRDLKPANVFISRRLDGSLCAKVLDFGIAKLVEQGAVGKELSLTATNAVMGSPRYMAPEQMRGLKDIDGRADIWAIGTTLYELLSGGAPFEGETLTQVCVSVMQDDPVPLVQRRPDIPPELDAIVLRCLQKRPDARFATVAELAHALAPFGSVASGHTSASRIGRVLAGGNPTSEESPVANPMSITTLETPRRAAMAGAAPSDVGLTNTSWGEAAARAPNRRRLWATISVVAVLSVACTTLAGALVLRRSQPIPSPIVAATAAPPPAASLVVDPIPTTPVTPVTTTTAVPSAVATTPPSAAITARPKDPIPSPAPPPASPSSAPPPTPPAPVVKPAAPAKPATPRSDLWDDRK